MVPNLWYLTLALVQNNIICKNTWAENEWIWHFCSHQALWLTIRRTHVEFTGSELTDMSLETEDFAAAKYGVLCQGGGWNRTNGVLTQITDKSLLHAVVKRPCYTFVAEIFNGADQYQMSNISVWNIFIRFKTKHKCVLSTRKYVTLSYCHTRMFHYWKR